MITLKTVKRVELFIFLVGSTISSLLFAGDQQLGKRLYQQGISINRAIANIAGNIEVGASRFPCQNCHLADGSGGFEGGVTVPPINWRSLTVRRPSQQQTAYDEKKLKRAIFEGIDSEGNQLNRLMPRYTFSDLDFQNLTSYLSRLDTFPETGVSDTTLRIGVILTKNKTLKNIVSLVNKILQAFFQKTNQNGGIHGRMIELVFSKPDNLQKDVLCYFASVVPESEQGALASNTDIPVLFPLSQLDADWAKIVSFQADFADQLSVLLAYIKKTGENVEKPITLVIDSDKQGKLLREKLEDTVTLRNQVTIIEIGSDQLTAHLINNGSHHLLWFSRQHDFVDFLDFLKQQKKTVTVYTSIDLVGRSLSTQLVMPDNIQLILSNPRGVPDTNSAEYKNYQHFRDINQLTDKYLEWQRTVYLASTLLADVLKKSGRKINRPKLYQTATEILEFHSGVMPPVNTSSTRTKPSQILKFDAKSRSLVPLQSWISTQNF